MRTEFLLLNKKNRKTRQQVSCEQKDSSREEIKRKTSGLSGFRNEKDQSSELQFHAGVSSLKRDVINARETDKTSLVQLLWVKIFGGCVLN